MTIRDLRAEPDLSEFDVQAFADGMLAPERAASVRRYLSSRPEEAHRVAFYSRLNRQMQQAFQASATEKVPSVKHGRKAVLIGAMILALTLAAIVGAIFAFDISDSALDHVAMTQLEQAESTPEPPLDMNARVFPAAPNLSSAGFHWTATRTLPLGPFAHATEFVYGNASGDPAVLLISTGVFNAKQPQWKALRVGERRLLAWTGHGTRYVLAGRADSRGLMRAADLMTARP
jgi:hypothetical protein